MEFLLLVGLGIWVLIIQIRLASAEGELRVLRRMTGAPPPPIARPPGVGETEPARAAPADPLPEAARVRVAMPPDPPPRPAPGPAPTAIAREPIEARPPPQRRPPSPPARTSAAAPSLSVWLSENGLAWLGGLALALGGALLVAYAAERGLFTPVFRIAAAVALGFVMLGAGEWIRRGRRAPGGRHRLAAAMCCGAGATTQYAAIWAAYALYHFLPVGVAAALLGGVSLALLGLALAHGEALGLLAIVGAFAAPVVCGLPSWNGIALDGYLMLIALTGLGATALRGWSRVGLLTLAVVGGWILDRVLQGDATGAAGLMVGAPAVTLLAVGRRSDAPSSATDERKLLAALPLAAVIGASGLLVLLSTRASLHEPLAAAVFVGCALAGLAAAASRLGLARPGLLGAPAVAIGLVVLVRSSLRPEIAWLGSPVWLLAPILALAVSGLGLGLTDRKRPEGAIIGAVGAAVALTLLRAALAGDATVVATSIFIIAAALFFAGGALIARGSPDPGSDLALAAWLGAGAEASGLAIHSGLAGRPEPAAYGALGIVLAVAARRLPWRGLAEAAALAALVSLSSILGPQVAAAALSGRLTSADLLMVAGAGVATQSGAWLVLRRRRSWSTSADAASASAVISGLLTAFLILRLFATPRGQAPASLDLFTEAALRTLLLLSAGLVLSLRAGGSVLSRARGPVLLILGLAHGLLFGVVLLNPWWGFGWEWAGGVAWPSPIGGPPVVDVLALAYLGPASLLAAAAWRQGGAPKGLRGAYGLAAFVFLGVWELMEVRRLFHGATLSDGDLGFSEAVAYGLALLTLVEAASLARRRLRARDTSTTSNLLETTRRGALGGSAALFCIVSPPWWGLVTGDFHDPGLYFSLLAAGVALTAWLTSAGRAKDPDVFGRAGRAAIIVEAFVFMTLAIRFGFHGAAMRSPLEEASVETWAYSVAWAVYGLLVLAVGARGHDRMIRWLGLTVLLGTTLKVFLFDMATLQGVIRAASFLALGALLVIGALAARRMAATRRGGEGPTTPSPNPEIEPRS